MVVYFMAESKKNHLENNSNKIVAGMEGHNSYMSYGQNFLK